MGTGGTGVAGRKRLPTPDVFDGPNDVVIVYYGASRRCMKLHPNTQPGKLFKGLVPFFISSTEN